MTHAHSTVTASIFVLALVSGAGDLRAQERGAEDPGDGGQEIAAPVASHGGRVELVPGAPVQEDDDPVNRLVASETVDGLLLSITLDGATASLDSAVLARIPKRLARPDRQVHGDAVEVRGLIDGQEATRTTVPDNLVNASEGDGLVRTTRRQIAVALVADRPLDAVHVRAPATGLDTVLDVSSAYAFICEADRGNRWCPRQRGASASPGP
jgi:hypothetical protein